MDDVRSVGTQVTGSKRQRAAEEGAEQAGQGLQVTVPRNIPHCYNNNFTVRLTYADTLQHSFNYGANAIQIFRSNSIYDPDYTNTGHQPYFRDLWASQYDYYTVLSCEYELQLYNGTVDSMTWTAVGTSTQRFGCASVSLLRTTNVNDFVSSSALYPIAEMKNVTTKFFPPEDVVSFSGTVTPGDFVVDAKDSDSDNTWVAVGSNPAVPRFIGYVLTSNQQSALVGQSETPWITAWVQVKLHYTVQFTQVNPSIREVPS